VTTISSSFPNQHFDSNLFTQIDIVEYVNTDKFNQYTLHTGSRGVCRTNPNVGPKYKSANGTMDKSFLATPITTECKSSPSNNAGCAFTDVEGSAGTSFNTAAGGVFAMLWDNTHIAIWRFERSKIPQDIQDGDPNPEAWGTPAALWSDESCDIAASFRDLSRTFLVLPFSKLHRVIYGVP